MDILSLGWYAAAGIGVFTVVKHLKEKRDQDEAREQLEFDTNTRINQMADYVEEKRKDLLANEKFKQNILPYFTKKEDAKSPEQTVV